MKCSKKVYELCVSENDENIKVSNAPETFKMWSKGHSNFAWNQILANWNGPKMSFLAILETLNYEFLVNLGLDSYSNVLKTNLRTSEITKSDIFGPFQFAKIWFHAK